MAVIQSVSKEIVYIIFEHFPIKHNNSAFLGIQQ